MNIVEISKIIDKLQDVIADYYNITKYDLKSKSLKPNICHARHIGMYLSKIITNSPYPKIGLEFGGRDPQTAKYSYTKILTSLEDDEVLNNEIKEILGKYEAVK